MRKKIDIYNNSKKLDKAFDKIKNSSLNKQNKKNILDFSNHLILKGLGKGRIIKYIYTMNSISKIVKKPFKKCNKKDIINLVRNIDERDYTDWTKHDYKIVIKVFYRWLRNSRTYPEEVEWINTRVKSRNLLPEEVLTEEEIVEIVKAAETLRDKALILLVYESGCRIGEILSLQIKNVQFDKYGAVLIVSGKTGGRRVRVISSVPKLTLWIENHPLKDDPNAPLWISYSTRKYYNLSYTAGKSIIKEAAKKAKIRKRVYPHLLRHSRATHLANHLTEAQMKQHFGWSKNSDMASLYVHLSGRDVDNALFKLQGIEEPSVKKKVPMQRILCLRCRKENSPGSKFCMQCGTPIQLHTAIKLDETRQKADKLMNYLIQDPRILEQLLNKIESMSHSS